MGQALAPAANEVHYARRRPEETTLYQVVQEHLESFLVQVEAETGANLPEFIKDEFDAFIQRAKSCCSSRAIDMDYCSNCGARLQIIAAIVDPAVITKILTHLHLPARAPPRSPARPVDVFQAA